MPIIPPIAVKIIDENENKLPPHKTGIKLPMVDPVIIPIQIIDFEPILILYYMYDY